MRKHRKHFIYVLLAGALIGAAGFGYSLLRAKGAGADAAASVVVAQESPTGVSASGQIVPARWAQLGFQIGGQIETLVEEGQPVEAGQVLAQLDDAELRHILHEARAAQALAQADLARLKAGARGEDIAAAEAALRAAQAEVTAASADRDRLTQGMQAAGIAAS